MSRHKLTFEDCQKGGSIGGIKAGIRARDSGALQSYRTPEHQRRAALCNGHARGSHTTPRAECPRCFPQERRVSY